MRKRLDCWTNSILEFESLIFDSELTRFESLLCDSDSDSVRFEPLRFTFSSISPLHSDSKLFDSLLFDSKSDSILVTSIRF